MRRLSDIVLNQKPLILHASETVKDACTQMGQRRLGSVLVTQPDGTLCGIFTGRDAVLRIIAEARDPASTTLSEVMTRKPVTMTPDKSAIDALRLMWDGGFRHIPVLKDGQILGVVSRGDFYAHEQDRFEEERDLWEHMR